MPFTSGKVVGTDSQQLGQTDALELVTLGQRKNLGISGMREGLYAIDVDVDRATVTVGSKDELLCDSQPITAPDWVGTDATAGPTGDIRVQYRAHGHSALARVIEDDSANASIIWREPQPRIAPGQSVVFYDQADELVLGGAVAARHMSVQPAAATA